MTLAEHFAQRRRRAAVGTKGRAATGIPAVAVLPCRIVGLLLGLPQDTVRSIEERALRKVRAGMEDAWHNP